MAALTRSCLQQSKNRKGKKMYTFELPIHEILVRSYIAPGQMEKMTGKYPKKVKMDLLPPSLDRKDDEDKFWMLQATGHHRHTMRLLAGDMTERYNAIVSIVQNIRASSVKKMEDGVSEGDHHHGDCACCDHVEKSN